MNLKLLCWLLLATLLMVDLCIAGKKDKKKAKKDKAKKSKDKGKSEEAPGALHAKNVGGLEPVPPHLSTPGDDPMQPLIAGGGECDPPMPGCGWSNFHQPRPEIALPFKNGTHVNGKPNPGSGMAPKPPSSPIDRFNAVLQVMKDTEELLGESLARSMYCEDKAPGLALIDDFLNSFKLKQPGSNKKPALPDYEGLGDDMVFGDDQEDELLREAEEDNVGGWWPEADHGLGPESMALQNRKKREVLNRARRMPNPLIWGKQRSAGPPADDGKQRSAGPAADDTSWLDMAPINSDMGGMDDDWLDVLADAEPMDPEFGQMSKPDEPQPAPGPPPEAEAMMEAIKVYVKQLLVLYCTPPIHKG